MLSKIAAHKRAETASRESEERFRALAENAPQMVWVAGATNALYIACSDPSLSSETRGALMLADQELRRAVHITRQTLGFFRDSLSPVPVPLPQVD